jgi:uncharacterized protein YceK
MEKRYITVIVILILFFCLTGCASIDYRTSYYGITPGIYPGVRNDIRNLFGYSGGIIPLGPEWVDDVFTILDIPFSFAFDTLCAPYDVFKNREKNVFIYSTNFDKVNNTVSFKGVNNTDKKLSVKVDISVQETWKDAHKEIPQAETIGRKTTNIILLPKSSEVFEENIECSPSAVRGRIFRTGVSIRSYKEVE